MSRLEQAVAANDTMEARPYAAISRLDLAHLLFDRGDPPSRDRANDLVTDARKTFEDLGMDECLLATDRLVTR